MKKNIFVVIVTFNGAQWLKKCLLSLQGSLYPVTVVVVDNNSSDDTVAIATSFSEVQLVQSKVNLGFGKANNIGIHKALVQGADYVFLLNQDTWIFPDTIQNLVAVAEANPQFGIVSPLHYSGNEKELDENFATYWHRKTAAINTNVDQVPFINAAAWLVSKKTIDTVGVFEPLFQHYGEDRNYTDRVLYHGFEIVVVKNAKICHDRIVTRHFKKDTIQSKFRMLSEVLNVNHSLFQGYWLALRSVFGLPKYFLRFYSVSQVLHLLFFLTGYFLLLKLHVFTLIKARKRYK